MEHYSKPLLSPRDYKIRVIKHLVICIGFMAFSLGMGILGYVTLAGFSFVDALLNASMILGGMGPVDGLKTNAAKVFASFYALYSGIAFLTTFAILLLPFVHRFLHRFHLKQSGF